MLIFLEEQALQKRDCPSKIGTVDNYEILAIMYYWHCDVLRIYLLAYSVPHAFSLFFYKAHKFR